MGQEIKLGMILLYEGGKGEKKKKGRRRRKGREEGGERRKVGILKKKINNDVHCKHWQPRVAIAVLTVVCVNRLIATADSLF